MIKMKNFNLTHNPKEPAGKSLKKSPKVGRSGNLSEIAARGATVRQELIASRGEFAARAANARKSLPSTFPSVLLG
jgi:hypothetical protein